MLHCIEALASALPPEPGFQVLSSLRFTKDTKLKMTWKVLFRKSMVQFRHLKLGDCQSPSFEGSAMTWCFIWYGSSGPFLKTWALMILAFHGAFLAKIPYSLDFLLTFLLRLRVARSEVSRWC